MQGFIYIGVKFEKLVSPNPVLMLLGYKKPNKQKSKELWGEERICGVSDNIVTRIMESHPRIV